MVRFPFGRGRKSGRYDFSPIHSILSRQEERRGRRRYHDRDVAEAAPNRLIGYVSAAHSSSYRQHKPVAESWRPYGRAVVVTIAVVMVVIWFLF